MNVERYEKIWMWISALLLLAFVGAIAITTGAMAVQPPSHLETIDPTTLANDAEFGSPAVKPNANGGVTVAVVASDFSFSPDPIEVPAGRPVTFRITSSDVIHGFEVIGTNANTMVIPGYVSQFTMTFAPGEYTIGCNEYCGVAHHAMVGKLIAKEVAK
jgi:cytochrome c oxidase subunit 2